MRAAPGCVCVSVRGCLSVPGESGGCWRRGGGAAGSSQRPGVRQEGGAAIRARGKGLRVQEGGLSPGGEALPGGC